MSLITETKKLQELEQKATPVKWILSNPLKGEYQIYSEFGDLNIEFEDSDIDDPRFIVVSRNLAPAMLSVLEYFQKGDAQRLQKILNCEMLSSGDFAAVRRLQKAASLMEQDS